MRDRVQRDFRGESAMSTQRSVLSAICALGFFKKSVVRTSRGSRRCSCGIAILLAAMLQSTAASAEDVVVKRHVTVRESPNRQSEVVKFPAVGEALTLLDGGSKT